MIFPIKFRVIQPEKGDKRKIKACLAPQESYQFLSIMGTFKYYHFLRELFEDISKFHRIGNLVFIKPGLGELCISWTILETMRNYEVRESIIDGVENLNRIHLEKYQDKFSLLNSVPFELDTDNLLNEDSFELILNIGIRHSDQILVMNR